MDPTSPPRRRALAPRAQRHGHLGSDKKSKSKAIVTDPWVFAQINFLDDQCSRLNAGRVALFFLKEAKSRYRQYRGCGCPRLRYLCWSARNLVANQLVGRKASEPAVTIGVNVKEAR
jgi:hypothetical protein